ncbi:T9SS type A sorting domain-containing protein [Aureispira anguillae]|uniref:T9SS type A sorting domain-containing protein n=1 Tax=Aureispira anguillae TaxID=2864201 RepID=A0A915Y9U9_9BACT|nr:T9SS type A sorting domain-containing protein [Aureispira anguillae]BDS09449.1 T9SS type A sorting domain-containing protein [Aureispira anguillae]
MKLLIIFSFCVLCSCLNAQSNANLYSFFVAGHTYGEIGQNNIGLHPPFKMKFDYIKGRTEIQFGILTGDIVSPNPVAQDWDEVDLDIDSLGIPVYFSAGNHDMENRPVYESRYGRTYYDFTFQNDLFIVLDPNLDHWNISGNQLVYLKNLLQTSARTADNIYVFFHQVLWREHDNKYSDITPNSFAGKINPTDRINFWTEVEPLFHELPNRVVMFSGDFGGAPWSTPFMYDTYDNITFIGSGMGKRNQDNFIVVNIDSSKSIDYDLICLEHADLYCLGELTDYQKTVEESKYACYPNPTDGEITIRLATDATTKIEVFSTAGKLLLQKKYERIYQSRIDLAPFDQGLYLIKITSPSQTSIFKIIKN